LKNKIPSWLRNTTKTLPTTSMPARQQPSMSTRPQPSMSDSSLSSARPQPSMPARPQNFQIFLTPSEDGAAYSLFFYYYMCGLNLLFSLGSDTDCGTIYSSHDGFVATPHHLAFFPYIASLDQVLPLELTDIILAYCDTDPQVSRPNGFQRAIEMSEVDHMDLYPQEVYVTPRLAQLVIEFELHPTNYPATRIYQELCAPIDTEGGNRVYNLLMDGRQSLGQHPPAFHTHQDLAFPDLLSLVRCRFAELEEIPMEMLDDLDAEYLEAELQPPDEPDEDEWTW
jgi:hypothetical protein